MAMSTRKRLTSGQKNSEKIGNCQREREKQVKGTEIERQEVKREDNLKKTEWTWGLSPGVGVSRRSPAKSRGPKSALHVWLHV